MKDDPHKWLAKLTDKPYIEPKEQTKAMESYMYGNPEDSLDRIRSSRKAQDRKLMKKGKR